MAIEPTKKTKSTYPALLRLAVGILDESKRLNGYIARMDTVDQAYMRYVSATDAKDRERAGAKVCGQALNTVVNPIVVSQVNSLVAFWAETYLTGYPIFGVVSPPDQKDDAAALEGIIQDHMTLSQSVPELLKMFYDGAKYNAMAWEVAWERLDTYDPVKEMTDLSASASTRVEVNHKHINYVRRIDLRNAHWDRTVSLVDVDTKGRYAGYTERVNGTTLMQHLMYLEDEKELAGDLSDIIARLHKSTSSTSDYNEPTDYSETMRAYRPTEAATDWSAIFGDESQQSKSVKVSSSLYNLHTFYLRIRPVDYGIKTASDSNRFHLFKLQVVNRDTVISLKQIVGPYGRLPMAFAHPIEDGMDIQTQSYGELAIPLQDATTRIMNMRLDSARRAIQDRGLYDPRLIRSEDINSPIPAAKIPVVPTGLADNDISKAYYPIPYDARGTDGLLQDAVLLENWQKELSGVNSATRGQFTKGNRTLGEFDTIMGNAEARLRLPNIVIEHRMMSKIKEALKLNLLMYGEDTEIISPRTGLPVELSIQRLQAYKMEFEIADGYLPKGKLINSEMIFNAMTMIGNSPQLQGALGYQLPSMLSHIMQLAGVRGFDRYAVAAPPDSAAAYEGLIRTQQAIMEAVNNLQQAVGTQPTDFEGAAQAEQEPEGEQQ